ncbi:MAG: hypothetical protein KatS3mg067_0122 [Thermosynechococcus sp.]|uniref:hypothetical protein n=1 Tax=Thermosynechococcus sp. TaxID=2814275 RepID=UPI002206BFAE|nr:hypothetical protein [Thermosynechococcus sp.]BCX11184.1 MAG: hypothetical protein KatS3mg067_0122 [Thermosynechococcus sp.]
MVPFLINKVWGFVAELALGARVPEAGGKFRLGSPDIPQLLAQLECLQCRALFLEWLYQCRPA